MPATAEIVVDIPQRCQFPVNNGLSGSEHPPKPQQRHDDSPGGRNDQSDRRHSQCDGENSEPNTREHIRKQYHHALSPRENF